MKEEQRVAPHLLDEDPDYLGIELRPRVALKLLAGFLGRHRVAVRPPGDHRAEGIRHADEAGFQRDLLAAKPRWVASAVEVLVVVQDGRGDGAQRGDLLHQPVADPRMKLYDGAFLRGQAGGLEQDALADADLPYVVQQGAEDELLSAVRRQAEPVRDRGDV